MSITASKAICLHAHAPELTFLNLVRRRMTKILGHQFTQFELRDPKSHTDATTAVKQATEGFIILFAHGGSDYLHGGEFQRVGEICRVDKFLHPDNLNVFKGKVVFCMSCNSNELAQRCLDAGALAFVGFDDIPLSRFNAEGNHAGSQAVDKHLRVLIVGAIGSALERFVTEVCTLDEAVDYLRLWISKMALAFAKKYAGREKFSREIAALSLKLKHGVRYHGPLGIRFKKE